jgi:hypothetical protein
MPTKRSCGVQPPEDAARLGSTFKRAKEEVIAKVEEVKEL